MSAPAPAPVAQRLCNHTLYDLLQCDETARRERVRGWRAGSQTMWTPAQRAAVSAHWSAELRARIATSAPRQPTLSEEREAMGPRIMVDLE